MVATPVISTKTRGYGEQDFQCKQQRYQTLDTGTDVNTVGVETARSFAVM